MAKSTINALKKKIAAHNAKLQELHEEGRTLILQSLQQLFNKEPNLQRIGWTQYTPYFNDGDTCEFGVNADQSSIYLNGVNAYYEDEHDDDDEGDGVKETKKVVKFSEKDGKLLRQQIAEIVNSLGDEVLEGWGEGRVVIARDLTIKVEDYEHD